MTRWLLAGLLFAAGCAASPVRDPSFATALSPDFCDPRGNCNVGKAP